MSLDLTFTIINNIFTKKINAMLKENKSMEEIASILNIKKKDIAKTIEDDEITKKIDSLLKVNKSIAEISSICEIDKEDIIKIKKKIIISHIGKTPLIEIKGLYHLSEEQYYIYIDLHKQINCLKRANIGELNASPEPELKL